jgi:hypothetical protein
MQGGRESCSPRQGGAETTHLMDGEAGMQATADGESKGSPRGSGRASTRRLTLLLAAALLLAVLAAIPAAAESQQQFQVWRSPQFGLALSYPVTWSVSEEQSDPERGDVLILGNETSALLIGLLHDTRTPRQMAVDLVQTQKEATPDLAVVQSEDTSAGSVLMFLQYTIHPQSTTAMLIDEKALLGSLEPGISTITLRGMVPDRADVESEFEQIERIIGTLAPDQ